MRRVAAHPQRGVDDLLHVDDIHRPVAVQIVDGMDVRDVALAVDPDVARARRAASVVRSVAPAEGNPPPDTLT